MADEYVKKYNVKLPKCCSYRKIQAAQAWSDFKRDARRKAFNNDAVSDEDLARSKAIAAEAREAFDLHTADDSLEHR